jgi:hypothetical protein
MPAVVSNRVQAHPKDKLPPGAIEAEFADLKAASIKRGDDYPFDEAHSLAMKDEVVAPRRLKPKTKGGNIHV